MNTTITLGDAGLIIIGIGLVILIFYCIQLVKNLIPAVKTANRIMEEAQILIKTASAGAEEAQKIVGELSEATSLLSQAIKGNQSIIKAATALVNSVISLNNLIKK